MNLVLSYGQVMKRMDFDSLYEQYLNKTLQYRRMILKKLPTINVISLRITFYNHYQTLKVSPNATPQQIKHSFLHLAKKYHPDNITQTPQYTSHTHQDFIKLKQAYDTLKQPNSRKAYDLEHFPQNIQEQTKNFYYYRTAEFQYNHLRRKQEQRRKINFVLNSLIVVSLAGLVVNYFDFQKVFGISTIHQIRRQNIILANQNIDDGPFVQQRRRQFYEKQMKEKNIYGNVIQLKVRGAGQQSTRAREKRLNGIASIQGVQKERIRSSEGNNSQKQQFM